LRPARSILSRTPATLCTACSPAWNGEPSCVQPRATRELRRGAVALVSSPCLEVPGPRPLRPADLERDAEPLAELGAVALVGTRRVAQTVVHVQRADMLVPGDPHRQVEQAGRVSATREQHHHGTSRRQQPARAHALQQAHRSARWRAMNTSVGSLKPLSLTSAIRWNSRCDPAHSTTGRVTSTSPAADRAATREAMLTSRP